MSVLADHKKGHSVILLYPNGKVYSSEIFSDQLYSWLVTGGSITFVIGGADDLLSKLKSIIFAKESAFALLSLSPLTMTYQFSRVLLIKQIYRANEIWKGTWPNFRIISWIKECET